MKLQKLLVIWLVLLCTNMCYARDINVTLQWDANTVDDDLAGYRIYASNTSGSYSNIPIAELSTTQTEATVVVPDGVTYFVATCYDTAGNESEYSNEVYTTGVAPEGVNNLRITITINVDVN